MIKLRIFVSSVQKEMADERRAVKSLVASDPFLDENKLHESATIRNRFPEYLQPDEWCSRPKYPQLSATYNGSIRNHMKKVQKPYLDVGH